MPAPKIDPRTYEQIVNETEGYVEQFEQFPGHRWRPGQPLDPGGALTHIFGRYMELVIDRLNQVPEKNFLTFLNLIGADIQPPQPARAPLTFQLAGNCPVDTVVPAGTQVAAPPSEAIAEEGIFETEQELVVSRTQLKAVIVYQGHTLKDCTAVATGLQDDTFPAFAVEASTGQPANQYLYLACDAFQLPGLKTVTLTFETIFDVAGRLPGELTWSYWSGDDWQVVTAPQVTGKSVKFDLPEIPLRKINDRFGAWLQARRLALSPNSPRPKTLPTPRVRIKHIAVDVARKLLPQLAFVNSTPVDLNKEFYPFGEQPRTNDVFYLSCADVLTSGANRLQIQISLSQPGLPGGREPADPNGQSIKTVWQYWDGGKWADIENVVDETQNFTNSIGIIEFDLPSNLKSTNVHGKQSCWLRVCLKQGNYGISTYRRVTDEDSKTHKYEFFPANYCPPIIDSLSFIVTMKEAVELSSCLSYNELNYIDHTEENINQKAFNPFTPFIDAQPSLYLGFDTNFGNSTVSLYAQVEPPQADEVILEKGITGSPRVAWQYITQGGIWKPLGVQDGTQAFSQRGLIQFVSPLDVQKQQLFGQELYWYRARLEENTNFPVPPMLRRILLNTTWASQSTTIRAELLGSSNGNPGQLFQLAQSPVLPSIFLEIREPEFPSQEDHKQIKSLEGADAIRVTLDTVGNQDEIWVRWHAVPDFHASGPHDRHFTIDYLTGIVRFGDGQYGRIPPIGQNNIRAAQYRYGGGVAGNRPSNSIVQIKSSLPYIAGVTNYESASGGADRQSLEYVQRYGPRQLRHQGRAVAAEDFEDLAFTASSEVARAKAIPCISEDRAGRVGLIIVPRSDVPQPIPSVGLMEQVKAYLLARCAPTLDLQICGPNWVEVTVEADIAIGAEQISITNKIRADLVAALERFLHPLTGGALGKGWPFGRRPYASDLYALIKDVKGIDHVKNLNVKLTPDPTQIPSPNQFLIHSGQHKVTVSSD